MKEFYIQFFTVNMKNYENLGWDFEINIMLMALMPIFIVGCILIHVFRKNIFYTVKQLTRHGATTPDTAVTLTKMKLADRRIIKYMLSHDTQLSKIVKRKGAPEYTYEEYRELEKTKSLPSEKIDFDEAEFYLAKESDDRAKKVLERYDIPVSRIVLLCVFVFVIFMIIMLLMPELLTLINNLVGFVKGLYK